MFDSWTVNGIVPYGACRNLCSNSCYVVSDPQTIKNFCEREYRKLYVSKDGVAPKNAKTSITLNSGNQTLNLSLME